jgi:hypothetical protein
MGFFNAMASFDQLICIKEYTKEKKVKGKRKVSIFVIVLIFPILFYMQSWHIP